MNRLATAPAATANNTQRIQARRIDKLMRERDRAASEAGELTALLCEIEHLAGAKSITPSMAAKIRQLCESGKAYTCGANLLARLRKAENAVVNISINLRN